MKTPNAKPALSFLSIGFMMIAALSASNLRAGQVTYTFTGTVFFPNPSVGTSESFSVTTDGFISSNTWLQPSALSTCGNCGQGPQFLLHVPETDGRSSVFYVDWITFGDQTSTYAFPEGTFSSLGTFQPLPYVQNFTLASIGTLTISVASSAAPEPLPIALITVSFFTCWAVRHRLRC